MTQTSNAIKQARETLHQQMTILHRQQLIVGGGGGGARLPHSLEKWYPSLFSSLKMTHFCVAKH